MKPARTRAFLPLALAAVSLAATASAGTWEPLFNGRDLSGWKQVNGTAPYAVVDGAIVGTTVPGSPNSFLATEKTFGDFLFECEVKQEGGPSNSGVQFRSESRPDFQNGRVHGYQVEIDPSPRAWTGGIYDEARRGWLYPVTLNPRAKTAYQYGRWNLIRIEAIGPSIRTWVNGIPAAHVIDDTPALTPLQLRTKCRRLHLEFQLDLILVDYLQVMSSGMRSENRVQEVSYTSRNMKVLARELNVPVLAAAQLSRAIEQRADKEPQLSDLRESGSLEQDADIVMFIHRPELYEKDTLKKNVAQIKVSKHRNGPVGTSELILRNNLAKFENAATRVVDLSQVA